MRLLRRVLASLRPSVTIHVTNNWHVEGEMGPAATARVGQLLADHDRELVRMIRSAP